MSKSLEDIARMFDARGTQKLKLHPSASGYKTQKKLLDRENYVWREAASILREIDQCSETNNMW